jgi:ParB/RepB/Spo0J family partition protein
LIEQEIKVESIPLNEIQPSKDTQSRKEFDEQSLQELANSIKVHGVKQPIRVRPKHRGKHPIIAGERRWRAAKMAGLKHIPAIIVDAKGTDKQNEVDMKMESLIENVHRKDLTPTEREEAIYSLWKSQQFETPGTLAKALGYSPEYTAQIIDAASFRERNKSKLPENISASTISETRGLDDESRLEIIHRVAKGAIERKSPMQDIRDAVRLLKQAPVPLQDAVKRNLLSVQDGWRLMDNFEKAEKELGKPLPLAKVADAVDIAINQKWASEEQDRVREKQIMTTLAPKSDKEAKQAENTVNIVRSGGGSYVNRTEDDVERQKEESKMATAHRLAREEYGKVRGAISIMLSAFGISSGRGNKTSERNRELRKAGRVHVYKALRTDELEEYIFDYLEPLYKELSEAIEDGRTELRQRKADLK